MVQRAERDPSMEEIVVALRETRRSADRMHPFPVAETSRTSRARFGAADVADLRDSEIERLLSENARLNTRVVTLLKVLEQEQARHADLEAEAAPSEVDQAAIYREVKTALEAELRPALLVLLRLLQKRFAETAADDSHAGRKMTLPAASAAVPSEWIVELMHKLDGRASAPNDSVAAGEPAARKPKLRQYMADVLNAFGFEAHAGTPGQRFSSDERA